MTDVAPETVATQMAVALARLLRDGETVFFGVASPLPMVAALLAKRLHAPNLVILTAERIVDRAVLAAEPERTSIPGFLVEAVVEAPNGAWPTSCAGLYAYDEPFLADLMAVAGDPERLARFVDERILQMVPAT